MTTLLQQPLFAPVAAVSTTTAFHLRSTVVITRMLEVRRVHNSHRELRVSIDVPGAKKEDLALHLYGGSNPVIQIHGVINGESLSKTMDLPSTTSSGGAALDLSQLHAQFSNGVLEIVAPKLLPSSVPGLKVNPARLAAHKRIPVL